ncbi:hypothetical protein [Thalassospira tepidiphila]|uniref:Periplasmic heavy metal sensor n=1 Tax=Thalassospira tepidiphila TaxID=393657 RepID=A0ABX0WW50_9PROT|nr:hypothetical protein [Thalassospira tepidiphila]NJB73537.1 hypothetical protein [Thalassospira tepidiphila]
MLILPRLSQIAFRVAFPALILLGLTIPLTAHAQGNAHMHRTDNAQRGSNMASDASTPSPYVGQQHRPVKSLSADDMAELRKGGGWGLAKAAELNGVPGPAHLLELSAQIPLSSDQHAAITALYADMKENAIIAGNRLIEAEVALDAAFKAGGLTAEELEGLINTITQSLGRLRYVHLSTHLKTPEILSPDQIARYNSLRGYDG